MTERWSRDENIAQLEELGNLIADHAPKHLRNGDDKFILDYLDGNNASLHPIRMWRGPSGPEWFFADLRVYSMFSLASRFCLILIFYHTPEGKYGYIPISNDPSEIGSKLDHLYKAYKRDKVVATVLKWATDEIKEWKQLIGRKKRLPPPAYWKYK